MSSTSTTKKKPAPVPVVVVSERPLLHDIAIGVLIGVLTLELVRKLHEP